MQIDRTSAAAFVLISVTVIGAHAQQGTIPERVERVRPRPLVLETIDSEVAVPSFESAVRDSDLILEGLITNPRAYLSNDQQRLYTDYDILPINVVAARHVISADKPGPIPLILKTGGGETTINGVNVKIFTSSMLPLPVDRPLLLFLTFNEQERKYQIYHQRSWVFERQSDRRLRPLMRQPDVFEPQVLKMSFEEVLSEVKRQWKQ